MLEIVHLVMWSMVLGGELVLVAVIVIHEIAQVQASAGLGPIPTARLRSMIEPGIRAILAGDP